MKRLVTSIAAWLLPIISVSAAGPNVIEGAKLTGDFDANGNKITNLGGLNLPQSSVEKLPSPSSPGRIVRLSDGPAAGALVIDDGTNWTTLTAKEQKLFVVTAPPFNAPNDDTGDATAGIQAAINAAFKVGGGKVLLPSGKYRLLEGLALSSSVTLEGDGWTTDLGARNSSVNSPTAGTWLHIADTHSSAVTITGPSQSTTIRGVGFYCDQPVPGPGWKPTIYPYAIRITGRAASDVFVQNVMFLNVSHGIIQDSQNGKYSEGKFNYDGIYGQPLLVGLRIEFAADTGRANNFHLWTYWSNDKHVLDFQRANAVGIQLFRVDNPQFTNIMCYGYNRLFELGKNSVGVTSKMKAENVDADFSNSVIRINSDAAGAHVSMSNVRGGGGDAAVAQPLFDLQASGLVFQASNVFGDILPAQMFKIGGASNTAEISNLLCFKWDKANGGYYAVESDSPGNRVRVNGYHIDPSGGTGGTRYWGGPGGSAISRMNGNGDISLDKTITAAGTTGARTINRESGTVRFAASTSSLAITNSFVTPATKIIATVQTHDAAMFSCQAVAGSGRFTLYPNAPPAAETEVYWELRN